LENILNLLDKYLKRVYTEIEGKKKGGLKGWK